MFTRPNVAVRIAAVNHRQMEKDEAEIALVELSCEINPLSAELAGDLHDFVRGTLYTRTGAEVNSLLGGASFNLSLRPQMVVVRMAPDQKKDSFTIDEAKVSDVKAKRSKKSAAWTLAFKVTCAPVSEHQLAQLVEGYLKSRYLTFEDAEPSLFEEEETATSRRVSPVEEDAAGEGAVAH